MEYLSDVLVRISGKYVSPYILIGGDMNRREITKATKDFPSIKKIITEPTRGKNVLDVSASNLMI